MLQMFRSVTEGHIGEADPGTQVRARHAPSVQLSEAAHAAVVVALPRASQVASSVPLTQRRALGVHT